jgi:DNA-binding transcriptional regulator YiaG
MNGDLLTIKLQGSIVNNLRKQQATLYRDATTSRKDGNMQVMADAPLKEIRLSLNVSQEEVARRTRSVRMGTVRNAESGKRVTYDTAIQILQAINGLLEEKGRAKVTLDDLGLTLY